MQSREILYYVEQNSNLI